MPRYTGPESLQHIQDGIAVRLDDGGKLDFSPENGLFRLTIITPRGGKLPVALITAERLRNIGAALIALANNQGVPEPAPAPGENEGNRFTLLEID